MYNRFLDDNRRKEIIRESKIEHENAHQKLIRAQLSDQFHGRVDQWMVGKLQEIQDSGVEAAPGSFYVDKRTVFRDRERAKELGDGRVSLNRYEPVKDRIKELDRKSPRLIEPYGTIREKSKEYRPRSRSLELGSNWRFGNEKNERLRIQSQIEKDKLYFSTSETDKTIFDERAKGSYFNSTVMYPPGQDGILSPIDYAARPSDFHKERNISPLRKLESPKGNPHEHANSPSPQPSRRSPMPPISRTPSPTKQFVSFLSGLLTFDILEYMTTIRNMAYSPVPSSPSPSSSIRFPMLNPTSPGAPKVGEGEDEAGAALAKQLAKYTIEKQKIIRRTATETPW